MPRLATLGAVALLLVSCGGSGGSGGPSTLTPNDPNTLVAQLASYDLAVGETGRVIVGLQTGDSYFVSYGQVRLAFSQVGEGTSRRAGPVATASFLPIPGDPFNASKAGPAAVLPTEGRGVYGATVAFDQPGFWEVEVTADMVDRGRRTATAAFEVLAKHEIPTVGEPALKTENHVVGAIDVPAPAIDSRAAGSTPLPDPELHDATIAGAVAAGRPALVVFATPVFCISRFCGPVVDMVSELEAEYRDRAEFIHIEIWRDYEKQQINKAAADWLLRRDNLQEPWVFLIGADGKIAARWDNVASRGEIEPLLQALPARQGP